MLFRSIFSKNSMCVTNQINFLAKNYRPKCDICSNLCGLEWYVQNQVEISTEEDPFKKVKNSMLVCEKCFQGGNIPKGLTKEDFEIANFYNIAKPSESNYF
jgi:hypothetical protein